MVAECSADVCVEAWNNCCWDVEHVHPDVGRSWLRVDGDGVGFRDGIHGGVNGVCGYCRGGLRRHHSHTHSHNHGGHNGRVNVARLNRLVANRGVSDLPLGPLLHDYVAVLPDSPRNEVGLSSHNERSRFHDSSLGHGFANRIHLGDCDERIHGSRRALAREELADAVGVGGRFMSPTAIEIAGVS